LHGYKLGNISSEILSGPMRVFFSEVLKLIDVQKYINSRLKFNPGLALIVL
jgi:hypothetical protein